MARFNQKTISKLVDWVLFTLLNEKQKRLFQAGLPTARKTCCENGHVVVKNMRKTEDKTSKASPLQPGLYRKGVS